MKQFEMPWYNLRSAVSSDDTALTTFDYDSWPAAGPISLGPDGGQERLGDAGRLLVAFFGENTADFTAAYKLFIRRKMNGPILLLAAGALTLGTQAVTKHPITKEADSGLWVDTITVTGGLAAAFSPTILDSANNRIALLRVPREGILDLYCEIDLDGGAGTQMTKLSAIVSGVMGLDGMGAA